MGSGSGVPATATSFAVGLFLDSALSARCFHRGLGRRCRSRLCCNGCFLPAPRHASTASLYFHMKILFVQKPRSHGRPMHVQCQEGLPPFLSCGGRHLSARSSSSPRYCCRYHLLFQVPFDHFQMSFAHLR